MLKKSFKIVNKKFVLFCLFFIFGIFVSCNKKNENSIQNNESYLNEQAFIEELGLQDDFEFKTKGISSVYKGKQIDLDFSYLNSDELYSEVFNMLVDSDFYNNKVIRIKGTFNSFIPNGKTERAFLVVVSDGDACCQQGIEFKCKNKNYPQDFPKINSKVELIGSFVKAQTLQGADYFFIQCDELNELE